MWVYVNWRSLMRLNYNRVEVDGREVKFIYHDVSSFWKTQNVISNGKTKEEVPLSLLRGDFDAVIDVGAHIGIYSILLGILNPCADIYIFEPATPPLQLLKENIAINDLHNRSEISQKVVAGESNESMPFFEEDTAASERHGIAIGNKETTGSRQSIALSDMLNEHGISNPFLKIDAEGMEEQIIPDIVGSELTDSIKGIVEIHPDKLQETTEEELVSLLNSNGFNCEFVTASAPKYEHSRPIYWFETTTS